MKTNEDINQLLELFDKSKLGAYKVVYETASSALNELAKSWSEDTHDITDGQLTIYSRLLTRLTGKLDGGGYSIEYEVGRLSGIIESFERLYHEEKESLIIDAALTELLSHSKPASRLVLRVLYESRDHNEWIRNAVLEEKCSQTKSALSNIMRRLVQAHAVDYFKEGKYISYRLSPAGKRYYERKALSSMAHKEGTLNDIREGMSSILDIVTTMQSQMVQQTDSIQQLKSVLPQYGKNNWYYEQNILPDSLPENNLHSKMITDFTNIINNRTV